MNFTKPALISKRPRLMQINDLVVIFERHDSLDHLVIKPGKVFQNKYGAFHHSDMIGKPFGTKIKSRTSSGYIYVLEPTPELWSSAVYSRTQIVNELDSSVVTLMLDIHPGCTVVESGTGSGCMTLSLARAVAPSGRVFTYEYNNVRADTAREEFTKLRVDHLVSVQCRDVCGKYDQQQEGGGFSGVAEGQADAVFLDLPEPWLALEHVKRVLKGGKSICCYSPCMEQVMKVCEKLRELSFHSIRMMEVRQRPFDARVVNMETLHMGLSAEEEEVMNSSQADPLRSHMKALRSSASAQNQNQKRSGSGGEGEQVSKKARVAGEKKEDEQEEEEGEGDGDQHSDDGGEAEGGAEQIEAIDEGDAPAAIASDAIEGSVSHQARMNKRIMNRPKPAINGTYTSFVARPICSMKGHTAFLTFAIRSVD